MTFDKINRRTHLYLGIFLTPWFLLYAGSSVILNHGQLFRGSGTPKWTKVFEHEYRLPPIGDDDEADVPAEKILRDHGIEGRYRASVNEDGNLIVHRNKFLSTLRITYYPAKSRLVAEERRLPMDQFLTAAHFRAGFVYPYTLEVLWALFVDLVVLATLVWMASGV